LSSLFYEIKQFLSAEGEYGMILFEKTVDLNDLKDAACWFCQQLALGDVVCLKGDLGAGKSEFVRACIQALAGHPVDVPSPTFTLCQSYDTIKGPVLHYDLFRLEKVEDAWELGIIEQIMGSFSFIEWPQLIDASLKGHKRVFEINLKIASESQRHLQICQLEGTVA
jgi:tRNA threonylcarbamoyl adenosine modification protein YjeE